MRSRAIAIAGVLLGATVLLWSLYGFRYRESAEARDTFNRPLATKIADVAEGPTRTALLALERTRLLPRPYLWGLADVTRAGLEGRGYSLFAFGRSSTTTPFWLFPGLLLVKIPLGLLALSLLGAALAVADRSRSPVPPAVPALLLLAGLFLFFLARSGAGYAGVRHALPVLPVLAVLGGVGIERSFARPTTAMRLTALAAAGAALVSALPVVRPWEYFNALGGGTEGAYRLFGDEGVDIGQRTTELMEILRDELGPAGEVPFIEYPLAPELAKRHSVRARPWRNDVKEGQTTDSVSGVFLIAATRLAPAPWYDLAAFREARPAARRGNLLVFRGTYRVPWLTARHELSKAMSHLYGGAPDRTAARPLLRHALELYPEGYVAALELGNVELLAGDLAAAADAFESAHRHAPPGPVADRLAKNVLDLRAGRRPEPVRNPWLE